MKKEMKPDPKLQQAMAEMKEICKKYDCGGLVILASQTHGEYAVTFPEWSKCYLQTQPDGSEGLRFKAKGNDDDKTIGATVHMLQVFQKQSASWANFLDHLLEILETKMVITGGPKKL